MKPWLLLLTSVLLLTGCASLRQVDAQVQASAAHGGLVPGASYRFERLPLQAGQATTERVEALAETALTQVGLVRQDHTARYSVLPSVRIQPYTTDVWGDPYSRAMYPPGQIIIGTGNTGTMVGWGMRMPATTAYRYEISLLLRDLGTGQVVYEARAAHESTWRDSERILPALFRAALQDFPTPPTGPRTLTIDLPR